MRIIEKKLFKNTLAKVMAVTMAVTMIPAPVNASADTTTQTAADNAAATPTPTTATALPSPSPGANGEIKLAENTKYEISSTYTVNDNITIDLNGQTVEFKNDARIEVNSGILTIKDDSSNKTGQIKKTHDDSCTETNSLISVGNKGKTGIGITLESGKIENGYGFGITLKHGSKGTINGGTISTKYASVSGNYNLEGMNLDVLGGTLESKVGPCIYMPTTGTLVVGQDNTVSESAQNTIKEPELKGGISVRMGTVTINNGTITTVASTETKEEEALYDPGILPTKEEDVYFPDALYILGGTYGKKATNKLTLNINDGTFICDNKKGSAVAVYDYGKVEQDITVKINGGNFTKKFNATDSDLSGWQDKSAKNRNAFDVLPLSEIKNKTNGEYGNGYGSCNNTLAINITGGTFSKFSEDIKQYITDENCCLKNETAGGVTVAEHKPTSVDAKEAIAGTSGNIAYKHCGNCGKYYTSNGEILEDADEEKVKLYQLSLGSNTGNFTALFERKATAIPLALDGGLR